MKIYVRKIFPHDVTHEVSVRKDIVHSFFEGNCQNLNFIGKKSKTKGIVTINSATDPRFGGFFKKLLLDEGRANINDILLITKIDASNYELEIVKPKDKRYFALMVIFKEKTRHAFLESTDYFDKF